MSETFPTHFSHEKENFDRSIEFDSEYAIFEPVVEQLSPTGEIVSLNADEVLGQMQGYVRELAENHGFDPGIEVPLGGVKTHTLGEVLDTQGKDFLDELNDDEILPVPEALIGIINTMARVAEQSGFDRDKATIISAFMHDTQDGSNINLNLHSDGLGQRVTEDMISSGQEKLKIARFVYATGPGTIIYPKADIEGQYINSRSEENEVIENPDHWQSVNEPRFGILPDEQRLSSDAQQVLPGRILGFDPTRTLWHQAPEVEGLRAILVTDVFQIVD